jgi:molecular chaperone DnaK (HSP70)
MEEVQNTECRYSVGIDLGTTNCVVSYTELNTEEPQQLTLEIPQLVRPGQVENRSQLPSFVYQAHEAELGGSDRALPWSASAEHLVGGIARELGNKTPIRLVGSAKSWLCHTGSNSHEAFLPQGSPEEVAKISPVEATRVYLRHLQSAWDHQFPDHPLVKQQVTVTLPASFDPGARELTAEAAQSLGIAQLTLLEEPQAAVYSWLGNNENWRDQVNVGDTILVVDIGGGTTDLSLISVAEEQGELVLNRVAVGDHILLGGDNMDLALAYGLSTKLKQQGTKLAPWQIQALAHGCRDAKEALLGDSDVEAVPIVVPSRGSSLIGGSIRTELTRDEVLNALVDGFFPRVAVDEHPRQHTRSALTQVGLPYAQDAGITRHLAAFLCKHGEGSDDEDVNPFMPGAPAALDFIKPSAVIFNGGVLKAPMLSSRVMDTLNQWLSESDTPAARLLTGVDLDLAVARGASYYGFVRHGLATHGKGVRIRGGIASAYYVGIESAMPAIPGMAPPLEALCVAPFGMEEGSEVSVPGQPLGLVVGEPVHFRFLGSTVRRDDQAGELLDDWNETELEELPEIHINLPAEGRQQGEVVPVQLASRVTEMGILQLEAISVNGEERWNVEFNVRD